ncbi:MAG: SMP-30/gluconolactonase/LRE family protein [Tetrasphaera sp.]|nr:SMP-30/gluconolactonase/LRE family protein [Tetrasphaera sp.]
MPGGEAGGDAGGAVTILEGLTFPEGMRWHDGALWFSDMHDHSVWRWESCEAHSATATKVASFDGPCSGLGWLDAQTLLVSCQEDRHVRAVDLTTGGVRVHADLSEVAAWHLNDLLTDDRGRAYVGNYGGPPDLSVPVPPGVLALVDTDGTVRPVAGELLFANGMALLDGGRVLVVAETRAEPGRLTAFDVAEDGSLSNRRVHHQFLLQWPDGMAVDADGGVWVACPFSAEVLRVDRRGDLTDRLAIDHPYAVALGGADGRDLFIGTSESWLPEECVAQRSGAIHVARVRVPAP